MLGLLFIVSHSQPRWRGVRVLHLALRWTLPEIPFPESGRQVAAWTVLITCVLQPESDSLVLLVREIRTLVVEVASREEMRFVPQDWCISLVLDVARFLSSRFAWRVLALRRYVRYGEILTIATILRALSSPASASGEWYAFGLFLELVCLQVEMSHVTIALALLVCGIDTLERVVSLTFS